MNVNKVFRLTFVLFLILSTALLSACFDTKSDSSSDVDSTATVKLSGIISAPGGTSFAKAEGLGHRFADAMIKPAFAAVSNTEPVAAGVVVKLIDTTDDSVIASGMTTTGGAYELALPDDFIAAPEFIVQAGTTEKIEARVTDLTGVDVDMTTQAASQLIREIAPGSILARLNLQEIKDIVSEMADSVENTENDLDALTTLADLTAELVNSAKKDEEVINSITSTLSTGQICGTVTDDADNALANIRMVARDYGEWVTRAKALTAADGTYCLSVPVAGEQINSILNTTLHNGNYIVGAINRTGDTNDALLSASEWYTAAGGAPGQWQGDKVSLTSTTTTQTIDFKLAPGARVSGSVVSAETGLPIPGIKIILRDFVTWMPVSGARVSRDGTYRVNVPAGDYIIVARNRTRRPFATENFHDGNSDGISDNDAYIRQQADKVTLVAGDKSTADFPLIAGQRIVGRVLDAPGGNPVSGVRVRFDNSGNAGVLRTNKDGRFRIWLKPDTYVLRSRGQIAIVDISSSNVIQGFNANVTPLTSTITYAGNPQSEIVVILRKALDRSFVSQEISNSDGSFTIYAPSETDTYKVQILVKDGRSGAGSMTYATQTAGNAEYALNWGSGTEVSASSFPTEIRLPQGYEVTGTVSVTTGEIGGNRVYARDGATNGTGNAAATYTRGDGSYYLYLPAANYDRIRACTRGATPTCINQDGVDVPLTAATLDFAF